MAMISKAWAEANGFPKRDQFATVPYTGPYKVKEYVLGSSVELERNTKYFVPGRPFLDGI